VRKTIPIVLTLILGSLPIDISAQDIVWSAEAENGIISGTTEIISSCSYASAGEFVKLGSDTGNMLTFDDIEIDSAGNYGLKLDYYYDGEQPLEIIVNGNSQGTITFPQSIWCYQGIASEMALTIELTSGINTLEFKTTNGKNAPFLDRLEIFKVQPLDVSIFASGNRMFPGKEIELIVEASAISLSGDTVELKVTGISPANYSLTDSIVVIPPGKKKASTLINLAQADSIIGQTLVVSLLNPSGGLLLGDNSSVSIRIVGGPSVFFVSSSAGDDFNEGLSDLAPLRSLEKVNSTPLVPGDSVLFRSGDTFTGHLKINGSGAQGAPIVIGSYGQGARPVIDGANADGGAYLSAVYINNQDHIELRDLEITNDRRISRIGVADAQGYGIHVHNSSDSVMRYFRFRDLIIREVYAMNTEGQDFNAVKVAAINLQSDQNTIAGKEKNISDVLVENCYITHTTKIGIWSRHGGGSEGIGNDSINRNMNLVFRNNHFFETGGSGIILSRSYNCLLENNIFEYPGSGADPRMVNRGSGAWFWKSMNIVAQYNKSFHVRGYADSYGIHIDFGNRNVIMQYNYSEDSEGGFVEILGDNINSVYRFNVSVNDGFRDYKGNTIWISDYAGQGKDRIPSDNNYIYNNTIYSSGNLTPDIDVTGLKTYIYNNAFYTTDRAVIGETVKIKTATPGGALMISNNLFFGDVRNEFTGLDMAPVFGNPYFTMPGDLSKEGYKISSGSAALDAGLTFEEPLFPQAGKGIFKDIPPVPDKDPYGNPVSLSTHAPNIGAYNGVPVDVSVEDVPWKKGRDMVIYADNTTNTINIVAKFDKIGTLDIYMYDIFGRQVFSTQHYITKGMNSLKFGINNGIENGIYIVSVNNGEIFAGQKISLLR